MRALLSLLAAVLLCSPALARDESGSSHIIVIGGGKSAGDAGKALGQVKAMTLAPLAPGPGFPRTMKSDSIPGLNPGFHIAVFGFCANKDDAAAVRDMLNLRVDGVYTKAVKVGYPPQACPPTPRNEPGDPENMTLAKTESLKADQSWPSWQVFTGAGGPKGGNCTRAIVRVLARSGMLAQAVFEPDSCSPPHEGTMDEFWSLSSFPQSDGRNFVLIEHRQDWHDNGAVEYKLLHYGCATVQQVATLQPSMPYPAPKVELQGKTWRELAVVMTQEGETDTQRFRWNDKKCMFEPRK